MSSVSVDSRRVRRGAVFVALPGRRTDGHRFLDDAFAAGAAAAIVEDGRVVRGPAIVVDRAADALVALAASERARFRGPCIGITGSCGKTSTKDLTAAVLSSRLRVAASPASFNNEVGVPLTILEANPRTEVLVCEIGAGAVGEIARLCSVARPSIGVVTNVGLAHVETFGSPKAIARAKAELVQALLPHGVAILNGDDAVVRGFKDLTDARVMTFGVGRRTDVRATGIRLDPWGRARFEVRTEGSSQDVALIVPGRHIVMCALAAMACGLALGVDLAEAADALGKAPVSPWRMELRPAAGGATVLNDAYNANPASMAAALRAARSMHAEGRRIAVLGGMAELGSRSPGEHERIGRLVARLAFDGLVTVGEEATGIGAGARAAGMSPTALRQAVDAGRAIDLVRRLLRPGDLILVKGSRTAGLEVLVESLCEPGARGMGGPSWSPARDARASRHRRLR